MTGVIGTGQTSRPGGVTRPSPKGYNRSPKPADWVPFQRLPFKVYADRIRAYLREHPGCSKSALCGNVRGGKSLRPHLDRMIALGWVCDHGGDARAVRDRGSRLWLRSECWYLHPATAGRDGAEPAPRGPKRSDPSRLSRKLPNRSGGLSGPHSGHTPQTTQEEP